MKILHSFLYFGEPEKSTSGALGVNQEGSIARTTDVNTTNYRSRKMVTVQGEADLPFRKDGVKTYSLMGESFVTYWTHQTFVRSKIEPTVLMDYHSGDCYKRADGERWEWPAYQRDRKILLVNDERTPGPWSELQGKGAFCDDKTFPYRKAKAA